MAEILGTQRNDVEGVPYEGGRLVDKQSGHYGVSDERRAQLSQMEQDAGVQHEPADESVPQRVANAAERAAGLAAQPGAARPGDKQ